MSANIATVNGEAKIMYVGEKPWHGLGTELKNPATSAEAIKAAHLDYKVERREIVTKDGISCPDNFANVNTETKEVLGIVGSRYHIIQNIEAFDFFDNLVGGKQAIYHTAGAIGKGERIWIMAKLNSNIVVAKDDILEKNLLLTNSHDGSTTLMAYFTPIRVVCQNTLNASLTNCTNKINIRHCANYEQKLSTARNVLEISVKFYDSFQEAANLMVSKQINSTILKKYFADVVGLKDKDEDSRGRTLKENRIASMTNLFENGRGVNLEGVRGTVWAAYNSVTEFIDHEKNIKNADKDKTNKLRSIWFDNGARIKEKAFDKAMSLVA